MRNILILIFISFALTASTQVEDLSSLKPGMLKNMARNAERMNDKYTAVKLYRLYIQKRDRELKTIYHLAELEESIRDYKSALQNYQLAYSFERSEYKEALYHAARMEKMLGMYDQAKKDFQLYLDLNKKEIDRDLKKIVTNELLGCDTALMLMAAPKDVAIGNIGEKVNKPHIEFAPLPLESGELIYGTLNEKELVEYDLEDERPKRKLFIAEKESGVWVSKGEIDIPINDDEYHVVGGTYSLDGNRFYFSRCFEDWKLDMTCEIWVVKKKGSSWGQPEKLGEEINVPGYSSTQPTIGIETKTGKEILYFVSDRPDGVGGKDIWYSKYDAKKDFYANARNLGRSINTPRDEMSPFYFEQEKKLYYSTDGRAGLGGFDIYVARGELKKWIAPINLGPPINSSVDDIYYVLKKNGDSGFFVSNRKGGQQILHETCCDDIYEFFELEPVNVKMEGIAWQADAQDYLNGRTDDLMNSLNKSPLDNASVLVYIKENGQEVLLKFMETDESGKFDLLLEPEKEYRLVVSKEGFLNNEVNVSTVGVNRSLTIRKGVGLAVESDNSFVLENIEYEFNSPSLTPVARQKIDETLLKVLNDNPLLKIEIGSHTDSRGTDAYNIKLSQQRAESVVKYLTEKGIEKKRLVAKGYGETKPLLPNENPDGSDNEENRQRNRRTEFKIIGTMDAPRVISSDED